MLILTPEEAKAGMKLAAPVPRPEHSGQELLRAGYILEPSVLARLRAMEVRYLFIDFPGLEDLDRHLAPMLCPERQAMYQTMKRTIESCQRRMRPIVSYGEYYSAIRAMMATLLSQGDHPVYMDLMARKGGDDEVAHATSVAHLSVVLGIKLQEYLISQRPRLQPHHAKEVVNLGVAGMLHDLGKFQLPQSLWQYSEVNPPKTAEDLARWQSHPRLGHELIREGVEPTAAAAVFQHHQHFDGTGFPLVTTCGSTRTLCEKEIHIFARIIYVADLYDRLSVEANGSRRNNLEILHLMRTKYYQQVDPVVLQGLETIAPPFPPGSRLELSDGTQAIVVKHNHENPYRPVVRRTIGEDFKFDGEPLDLNLIDDPEIVSGSGMKTEGLVPV